MYQRIDVTGIIRTGIQVRGKVQYPQDILGTLVGERQILGKIDLTQAIGEDVPGWIKITDILPPDPDNTVSDKVYQDSPNDTVLQSAVSSSLTIIVVVRASYPIVEINGVASTLTQSADFGHYQGQVSITLSVGSPSYTITARTISPDNIAGAVDHMQLVVTTPPQILTLQFTGGYPGSQSELKSGDTFQITGTLDKLADAIDIQNFGALDSELIIVGSSTIFTITGTVADRGLVTQSLPARVRARDAITGAFGSTRDTNTGGGTVDGVNLVKLNNTYPSILIGSVSYPLGQGAIKNSEQASVPVTLSNYDSFNYTSLLGELNILSGTASLITVERAGGSYNVATPNLLIELIRTANDAHTVTQSVVKIANVASVLTVTTPYARLRSGGNDGTAAQDHAITITSDQDLLVAPSITPDAGAGLFLGTGFIGGPMIWTRTLRVSDNDLKGSFSWLNPVATNLSGIITASISSGMTYILGGFVSRTATWDAFQTVSRNLHVLVLDFSKVQAGLFSATNQPSTKWPVSTLPPKVDGFTINSVSISPHTVMWLDTTAAGSNSGEAYLYNYQEIV